MHYFTTQLIGKITRTDYQKILNDFAYGTDGGKDHAKASVQQFNVQVRKCVRDAVAVQDGGLKFDFTYSATFSGSKGPDERSKYL